MKFCSNTIGSEQVSNAEYISPLGFCPNDNNIDSTHFSDDVLDERQIQYPPPLEFEQNMVTNPIELDASHREEQQNIQGTIRKTNNDIFVFTYVGRFGQIC